MSEPAQLSSVRGTSASPALRRAPGGESLADVLERVLDKGVVIVGDIGVNVLDIELLTLRIRLLIASADTAREMGIDWWESDPFISSRARTDEDETKELRNRVAELERLVADRDGDRRTSRGGASEKQEKQTSKEQQS